MPAAQLNSLANSFRFDNGPITRNFGGECGSFSISKLVVSSVTAEHQTCDQRILVEINCRKLCQTELPERTRRKTAVDESC